MYGLFERAYAAIVRRLVRHSVIGGLLFASLVAFTGWWYVQLPTGFIPTEDQGYILLAVQLPDAASQARTREVMREIDGILAETEGVGSWITIGGLSLLNNSSAPNAGTVFASFSNFEERVQKKGQSLEKILGSIAGRVSGIQEAFILAFPPPAIRGLGVRGGFELQVEDRAGVGLLELERATQALVAEANQQSGLAGVSTSFRPGVPQLYLNVDREKVKTLDIELGDVFSTLQASLGSTYVNDFNKFGRTYQVRAQADQQFRAQPDDIGQLEVRNRAGQPVPISTLVRVERSFGPQVVNRYNLYPTASVTGAGAPGYSSGDALVLMEQIARIVLPASMGYEWTGVAYQGKQVGGEALYIFAIAILLVYLVLAAQYESWVLPLAVIFVVPLGLLGAIAAVAYRGYDNNIYTQIGIVLIIALASKNAILIVEFARDLRSRGRSIHEAAAEASRMRFRPIIMTSLAFILGVVPLVLANGAGPAGQRALGTAVFGGMIAATVLAVFFIPIFYVVFQSLDEKLRGGPRTPRDASVLDAPSH